MITLVGLIFIALRTVICWIVLGNPSKTHPFSLQSVCLILDSINEQIISSGTSLFLAKQSLILFPLSVLSRISFFNKLLVLTWIHPYFLAIQAAWVDLPLPGEPIIMTLSLLSGLLLFILISVEISSTK